MRSWICCAIALAANLMASSPVMAADVVFGQAEAGLSWRLDFGGAHAPQPGFALALGYRDRELDVAGQLLEFDVNGAGTQARLAGLPLLGTAHRVAQNDGALADATPRPWYLRQWVLWTAGGLAATLALTGGDGTVEYNGNGNTTSRSGNGCMTGANVNGTETPCPTDTVGTQCAEGADREVCVFCGNNGVTDGCNGWTERRVVATEAVSVERQRWLDTGTGHMGDLHAR